MPCSRTVFAALVLAFAGLLSCSSPASGTDTSSSSSSSGGASSSGGSSSGASSSGTPASEGSITIRFLTLAECEATHPVRNLNDDNDAVPDPAQTGTDYGPSLPGAYSGSFQFQYDPGTIPFSYTLVRPGPGVRRSYRFELVRFDKPLNRCVNSVLESTALRYEDQPESSVRDAGVTGGPIHLRFAVDTSKGPCGSVVNINTSAPGVGNNASLLKVYGPLSPGSYEGSFDWTPPGSRLQSVDFTYSLARPASGYKRTYVITLVTYIDALGCRFSANNPAKADEPIP